MNDVDFLKSITSMGVLGYDVFKIINVLDIDNEADFITEFNNPNSDVFKSYKKGCDKADYVIDIKLYELAKEGDLKALKAFEERKQNRIDLSKL